MKQEECKKCKDFWQFSNTKQPEPVAHNDERQGILYECKSCKAHWEETQRYAYKLSLDEIKKYYPAIKIKRE